MSALPNVSSSEFSLWEKELQPRRTHAIIAIAPAHNEAATIGAAIRALQSQTRPPDRIIISCDNCTDDTEAIAKAAGAEAFVTKDNTFKKAGALNQVMEALLPTLDPDDLIFCQDADTMMVPDFLAVASAEVHSDPRVLVSGRYACTPQNGFLNRKPGRHPGLVELVQATEFARDGRKIDRRGTYTHIMVGTSTLFPVRALLHISRARAAGILPGRGYVYEETSITEDFELTLAFKHLGYVTMSPPECLAVTEVMPTVVKLWHQRIRWMRGGVENLMMYGWNPITRRFIGRQLWILFGIFSAFMYLATLAVTLAVEGSIIFSLAWLPVTLIFIVDRVVTVRKLGWIAMVVSACMMPEIIYDFFQQTVYVTAVLKAVRRDAAEWHAT